MKKDGKRTLKDIYYSTESIEQFRTRCLERENVFQKKLSENSAKLRDAKQQIKDLKANRESKNKFFMDMIHSLNHEKLPKIETESNHRIEQIYKSKLGI